MLLIVASSANCPRIDSPPWRAIQRLSVDSTYLEGSGPSHLDQQVAARSVFGPAESRDCLRLPLGARPPRHRVWEEARCFPTLSGWQQPSWRWSDLAVTMPIRLCLNRIAKDFRGLLQFRVSYEPPSDGMAVWVTALGHCCQFAKDRVPGCLRSRFCLRHGISPWNRYLSRTHSEACRQRLRDH